MTAFAPAKVNLALHVTGRRDDGYHLLDSLVVFADVGDRLEITPAATSRLTVTGPFAEGVPTGPENLIWRAHALVLGAPPLAITLEKNLPHAAGIGGGSSDAAAVLRALSAKFGLPLPRIDAALTLGADVPVCLSTRPQRMTGIGEGLRDVPGLPPLWLVLVNPGVAVPTGAVFRGLATVEGTAMTPMEWQGAAGFVAWLKAQRNDLEPPARATAPIVGDVLDRLAATDGCLLAQMSGSGGTCFGLFDAPAPAHAAAQALAHANPGWWVRAARVLEPNAAGEA